MRRGFSSVGDVKALLERELQRRATLTTGDEIEVSDGATAYALRVLELQPEDAVRAPLPAHAAGPAPTCLTPAARRAPLVRAAARR